MYRSAKVSLSSSVACSDLNWLQKEDGQVAGVFGMEPLSHIIQRRT